MSERVSWRGPSHSRARKALRVCGCTCSTSGRAALAAAGRGPPRHPLAHCGTATPSAVALAATGRARTDAYGRGWDGANDRTGLGRVRIRLGRRGGRAPMQMDVVGKGLAL